MFRTVASIAIIACLIAQGRSDENYTVKQITFGPAHHLFGYIGHGKTIPWNASGRYILALRAGFDDHMPTLDDPADILLLDTQADFKARKIAETRGWNFQQGTMFYWNPDAAETQFFFNDRDPKDGTQFTVRFDLSKGENGERVREYRFPGSPVANSGVAPEGGHFLALNYGRLARLRLVTGYAGLDDWSKAEKAPENDGVFKVNIETGQRTLLVSYRQMQDKIGSDAAPADLFVNHTLWNRPGDRFYFYARGNFLSKLLKVDVPFTASADGSNLSRHDYMGGHPEWAEGNVMALSDGKRTVRYDTVTKQIVGSIAADGTFADPGGDVAYSPNGKWFVNGHKRGSKQDKANVGTVFTFFHEESGRFFYTEAFPIGGFVSGNLRIDPAPDWNRTSDQVLFGAYDPKSKTRQLFLLTINPQG